MSDDKLNFFKGLEKNLPKNNLRKGAIYHCTDTGNTYTSHDGTTLTPYSSVHNQVIYVSNATELQKAIEYAHDGATIILKTGNYGSLRLGRGTQCNADVNTPKTTQLHLKFPNDLTIQGEENATATFTGISISSGRKSNSPAYQVDETTSKISKNLTIKNVTITNRFSLRNADFDGLNLIKCNIGHGIFIAPNSYYDTYGFDTTAISQAKIRFASQKIQGKNVRISECTITGTVNINTRDSGLGKDFKVNSNIYIQDCENIIISKNTLSNCPDGKAIELRSSNYIDTLGTSANMESSFCKYCSGDIRVAENKIHHFDEYGIYLANLVDANAIVARNGFPADKIGEGKQILITNCFNTKTQFYRQSTNGKNYYTTDSQLRPDTKYGTITNFEKDVDYAVVYGGDYSTIDEQDTAINDLKKTLSTTIDEQDTAINDLKKTLSTTISNHTSNKENPHSVKANQLPDKNDLNWKTKIINAKETDNLANIIKNAQANSTIILEPGNYGRLNLFGINAFRDNITIKGTEDVIIEGVAISSAVGTGHDTHTLFNCDLQNATMSKGLTFKGMTFTESFSVVNCDITDLTVNNCLFEEGAHAEICPNAVKNCFGNFSEDARTFAHLPYYQTRYGHNITIKNCEFVEARKNVGSEEWTDKDTRTAIYMQTIDGANIHGNIIYAAGWNAIQITGVYTPNRFFAKSTGKIKITNNTMGVRRMQDQDENQFGLGSQAIRMSSIEKAEIILLNNRFNKIFNADSEYSPIKINCDYETKIFTKIKQGTFNYTETNGYCRDYDNGTGDFISFVSLSNIDDSDTICIVRGFSPSNSPHVIKHGTSGSWTYRKWSDGTAEMWGDPSLFSEHAAGVYQYYASLPFPLIEIQYGAMTFHGMNPDGLSFNDISLDQLEGEQGAAITFNIYHFGTLVGNDDQLEGIDFTTHFHIIGTFDKTYSDLPEDEI